jgi:hypothetical protein
MNVGFYIQETIALTINRNTSMSDLRVNGMLSNEG